MYMYVAMWYQLNHAGIARETANCLCVMPTGIRDESETLKNYNAVFKTFSHMYNNSPVMHQFVPNTRAKTLKGRKDTLAPVFFYWGDCPLRPPQDRRHWPHRSLNPLMHDLAKMVNSASFQIALASKLKTMG